MAENNSSAPLLPCPFCGGEADIQNGARGMWNIAGCKDAECGGFRASGWRNSPNEASSAWNTRAPQAVAAQAAPAAVAVPDERESYIDWLSGSHPRVFSKTDAEAYWRNEHVSALAWQARAALAATPALPATEYSSAGDLAEVQAEPVSSDPVAWHSKLYGTCWMHKQPYHLDAGTHFFVRGNPNPVATVLSGAAIQWHTGTAALEHGTFFYTAPQAQPADALTRAALDVLAERARQIGKEGYVPEADDSYVDAELAAAAATYALLATGADGWRVDDHWPWAQDSLKKGDARRMLEKAGALILAEMERLDRAAMAAAQEGGNAAKEA